MDTAEEKAREAAWEFLRFGYGAKLQNMQLNAMQMANEMFNAALPVESELASEA